MSGLSLEVALSLAGRKRVGGAPSGTERTVAQKEPAHVYCSSLIFKLSCREVQKFGGLTAHYGKCGLFWKDSCPLLNAWQTVIKRFSML